METETQFRSRLYEGEQDLQPICDLANLCEKEDELDEGFVTEAELRTEISNPDTVKERDVRIWEDGNGRIVGYGRLWFGEPGEEPVADGHFTFRVHPDARNMGLEEEMLRWAEGQASEVGKERGQPACLLAGLHFSTPEYIAYRQDVLERNGFKTVRYWFKMARDLTAPIPDPQLPQGFTLRHTEGAAEAGKWVECFNESFIDHWNHHPESPESHAHWLENSPNYDKEQDLVSIAPDGTWAAFCFCTIYSEDNMMRNRKEGWVDMLGTRRGFRKMGLGTAMLLAGMYKLKQDGMDTAVLGVDADNPTGALRLYEAVGFEKINSMTTFSKDVG